MQEDSKDLQSDLPSDSTEKNVTDVSLPTSEGLSSPSPSDGGDMSGERAFQPTEETPVFLNSYPFETDCDARAHAEKIPTEASEGQTVPQSTGARRGFVMTKQMIVVCAAIFVVCLFGAVFFGMWMNEIKKDPWRVESGLVNYGDFSSQSPTSDQIVIPGYGDILLEADTRDVMLILPNPASNPCYFRFTIVLAESGDTIYSSGLVPPGKAIQSLKLNRAFAEGDYPAIIQIETFSLDADRTPMNGANVETVLNFR